MADIRLDRAFLKRLPLPSLDEAGDKETRGRILIIGGSARVPGAILLGGIASLRAGAGKLQLATVACAAIPLGIAIPEAMVLGLAMTPDGELTLSDDDATARDALRELIAHADALLVGPGMMHEEAALAVIREVVDFMSPTAVLVLDGVASVALHAHPALLHPLGERVIITPHLGEMASLQSTTKEAVASRMSETAHAAAFRLRATVALKGARTCIACADGTIMHFSGGALGLATSGSGDTLAGMIAGLAARGAAPLVAAAWGVFVHGKAGRRLSRRIGKVGFLAREVLDEIPAILERLR